MTDELTDLRGIIQDKDVEITELKFKLARVEGELDELRGTVLKFPMERKLALIESVPRQDIVATDHLVDDRIPEDML